jgi:hypothetical protein
MAASRRVGEDPVDFLSRILGYVASKKDGPGAIGTRAQHELRCGPAIHLANVDQTAAVIACPQGLGFDGEQFGIGSHEAIIAGHGSGSMADPVELALGEQIGQYIDL